MYKNKSSIGLGIATYNEFLALQHCLNDIYKYFDDVFVLVDDRTNDSTIDFLKANNIKYKLNTFTEDFSQIYNSIKDNLKTDWILILDSDEKINKQSFSILKELTQENSDSYSFTRIHWEDIWHSKQDKTRISDDIIRYFKNDSKKYFYGLVNPILVNCKNTQHNKEIIINHYFFYFKDNKQKRDNKILNNKIQNIENAKGINNIKYGL